MEPINTRDMHIGVVLDDGTLQLVRRRNPNQVAWEIYAARKNLPANAGTLALTYQAFDALRRQGQAAGDFDSWADHVDEVYPAAPNGDRLIVDARGRLCTPDNEPLDDTPNPTQPAPDSGH